MVTIKNTDGQNLKSSMTPQRSFFSDEAEAQKKQSLAKDHTAQKGIKILAQSSCL